MKRVQNPHPYAVDTPKVIAPFEITEVEESEDLNRQLDAGVLVEVAALDVVGETGSEPVDLPKGSKIKKLKDS